MKSDLKRNGSGYLDPTAYQAIMNADAVSSVDKADRFKRREKDSEDRLNKLLAAIFAMLQIFMLRKGSWLRTSGPERFGGSGMIFVIKPVVRRSSEDIAKLQKKLYEDLNASKDRVLVLPPDCTYDIVNDYNRKNMVVIRDCSAEEDKN